MAYENEKYGVKVTIPEGWTAVEGDDSLTIKMIGAEFGPNITISRTEAPEELKLHQGGLDFFKKLIKEEVGDVEFGNEECITVNGHEGIAFNLGYSYELETGQIHVAKMQVYLKEKDKILSIAGTTTPDDFEDRYETFQEIASTVDFL